jgi:S-adenosyl methyltransferase
VRAQRDVLTRVVRFLTAEAGVTQLLDIGSGLPTAENVHQIAPAARTVYVDNDPVVLAHAATLLEGSDTAIAVDADLTDPAALLAGVRPHLAWDRPVGLLLKQGLGPVQFRTRQQILDLFAGLPLVPPGLVPVPEWRPEHPAGYHPALSLAAAGVARKP